MRERATRNRVAAVVGAAVALVVALAGCSAPEDEAEVPEQTAASFDEATQEQLSGAVQHAMGTIGATGAIVGVWAPWSGSWVEGVGTQTPEGGDVTADMQFRVAQLTRPMTCDVMYAVAAEGAIRLDDPVSDYVSGVADLNDVTLEQLCDGTSGIGSYAGQLRPLWMSNPTRVWDPRELASYGLGQPRTTEPGAAYRDSDAGYVLLGLALERATGKNASELIAQYVAEPLELSATTLPRGSSVTSSSGFLAGQLTMPAEGGGYDCAAPADVSSMSPSIGFTDAGVVSTVGDLRTYVQALATGASAPASTTDERFEGGLATYAKAPSWLTAAGGAVHAGSLIGNYGSVPGYATAAFADPETGLTVVVALNNSVRGGSAAVALAWELAAIASKAPAAEGETAPQAGLPWTPETYRESLASNAVCTPEPAS